MIFYLGIHKSGWISKMETPFFLSNRLLRRRVSTPRANVPWALDSGAFSHIAKYGTWTFGPLEYIEDVRRAHDEVGMLDWAAPQDWMCEPHMLEKTGLTIDDHQRLTVANFLELRWLAPELPIIPVLQGWELDDYLRCVQLYEDAGIDLDQEPVVGLGSVCRRQHTEEIVEVTSTLASLDLNLHGFGVKVRGLEQYADDLVSADSMAWSYHARKNNHQLPGCTHTNCANCRLYAEWWLDEKVTPCIPTH